MEGQYLFHEALLISWIWFVVIVRHTSFDISPSFRSKNTSHGQLQAAYDFGTATLLPCESLWMLLIFVWFVI